MIKKPDTNIEQKSNLEEITLEFKKTFPNIKKKDIKKISKKIFEETKKLVDIEFQWEDSEEWNPPLFYWSEYQVKNSEFDYQSWNYFWVYSPPYIILDNIWIKNIESYINQLKSENYDLFCNNFPNLESEVKINIKESVKSILLTEDELTNSIKAWNIRDPLSQINKDNINNLPEVLKCLLIDNASWYIFMDIYSYKKKWLLNDESNKIFEEWLKLKIDKIKKELITLSARLLNDDKVKIWDGYFWSVRLDTGFLDFCINNNQTEYFNIAEDKNEVNVEEFNEIYLEIIERLKKDPNELKDILSQTEYKEISWVKSVFWDLFDTINNQNKANVLIFEYIVNEIISEWKMWYINFINKDFITKSIS